MRSLALVSLMTVMATAACDDGPTNEYDWDARRVLCSARGDDLGDKSVEWSKLEPTLRYAQEHDAVALIHVHIPDETVSVERLTKIFDTADELGLEYVTYDELVPGPSHPGLALVFDDDSVDQWFALRDFFRQRGARLSFFVTRFAQFTPSERDELHELAADGHAIEAHGVDHLDALTYTEDHTIDQFLTDEVLPSIQILKDAGYHPTAYAYPYSRGNEAISAALLEHIDRVRVGGNSCPY